MTFKMPPSAAERLRAMLGDVANSINGGEDVSLDDIKPTAVTAETEAAFKEAQRKKAEKAEEENNDRR
jgi:hypothetical protein